MSLPEYYQAYFGTPMLNRCATVIQHFPLEFFYFELLQICFISLSLAGALGARGRIPAGCAAGLWRTIEKFLQPFPVLLRLLKTDCLQSGALPLPPDTRPSPGDSSRLATVCDWSDLSASLDLFARQGLLDWLDKEGVQRILEDESRIKTDFSSYL